MSHAPARAPLARRYGGRVTATPVLQYHLVTAAAMGAFGNLADPWITVNPGTNIVVGQDVFNPVTGWQQTLYVANPSQWFVIANMPTGGTSVVSFPSTGIFFGTPIPVSAMTSWFGTFNETMNATSNTSAEAAFDMWFVNSGNQNEMMAQHDMANRTLTSVIASAVFGGTGGGVPVQQWNLAVFNTEIIWQLNGSGAFWGEQTGTVDLLAMANWLIDYGYLAQGSQHSLGGYGWEICSTGTVNETFQVSQLAITYTTAATEQSPCLEVSGFVTGLTSGYVINSVTVTLSQYQSSVYANPCTFQLWDYSTAVPAQVGATAYGKHSASAANTTSATFYSGVTVNMLAALRVRIYGNSPSGSVNSVAGVSLAVNYSPPPGSNTSAGYAISMGMS